MPQPVLKMILDKDETTGSESSAVNPSISAVHDP